MADRFKLVLHREVKEEQVYELSVAKSGAKLKAVPDDPGTKGPQGLMRTGRGQITATATPISSLVSFFLARQLGRSVIDKTGLTGLYDFALHWTPEPGQDAAFGPPGPDAPPPPDPNGPTLFTALQEQLGLKLESAKGPVEILVIDTAGKTDAD